MHLHFKEGRRRMSDLADALLVSRGGATRLVARAEEDGLVRRETPPDDRRATYAVLTEAGAKAAERAYPAYVEVVQRLFPGFVRDEGAGGPVPVWGRGLAPHGVSCPPGGPAGAAPAR